MKKIIFVIVTLSAMNCDRLTTSIIEEKGLFHKNWYVHPDSALNTIQAALDSCFDGDSVTVAPGIYHENIVWPNTSGICLVSESGAEKTVIDGGNRDHVILIDRSVETRIDGFTIKNGHGRDGPAILCCGDKMKTTITRNIIRDNSPDSTLPGRTLPIIVSEYGQNLMDLTENEICYNQGLAICVSKAELTLSGNRIHHNWGGVYCEWSSAVIAGNTITDQTGGGMVGFHVGGIDCLECASLAITDNLIVRNSSGCCGSKGGGIRMSGCGESSNCNPVFFKGNVIDSNYADQGGGVYATGSHVEMQFNSINANGGWFGGAGIFFENGEAKICGCGIRDNHGYPTHHGGDGIRIKNSRVTISYCEFSGNQSYGVFCESLGVPVDARLNWWGDASGPAGAGPGSGDSVSAYVVFDPWLTEPWTGGSSSSLSGIRPGKRF